ncbi:MAG: winged helix-turn-helix domain-containing protein [Candidatus Woesearchaeota archaeon]
MKKTLNIGESKYDADENDALFIKSVIIPQINAGENVNIFCSTSYFTTNYTDLFFLGELAELVKKGCTLYLMVWDINAECNPYFIRIINERHISAEQLLNEKIQEVASILSSLGANPSKVHIYRASDAIKRFVRKESPNLFVKYYEATERMSLNNLILKHKVSHLIQMPMDIFFAYFFNELYPEDIADNIDCIICYDYQYEIYSEMRNILHDKGLWKIVKPALLICPTHPYLSRNESLPEAGMSREAIVQHILACNPSSEDIRQMYDVVLRRTLSEYTLLEKNDRIVMLKYPEFLKRNKHLPHHNQLVSLAHNLHRYLEILYSKITKEKPAHVAYLKNVADTINIAKILSKKRLVQILQQIDGTKNATEIAKSLQIARSNMSNYLKTLKKNNLIEIDSEGRIRRKISAVKANFEVGIYS